MDVGHCEHCRAEFKPYLIKKILTRFCSRRCYHLYQRVLSKTRAPKPIPPTKCAWCKAIFTTKARRCRTNPAKFCGMTCYHAWRKTQYVRPKPKCHPDRKHAAHGLCLACFSAMRREKFGKRYHYPTRSRAFHLKKTYGLTPEDYRAMFDAQGGQCALCHTDAFVLKKRLAVDHCHATGKIRDLLCDFCNHGLGRFKDNRELLRRAIAYLDKHHPQESA